MLLALGAGSLSSAEPADFEVAERLRQRKMYPQAADAYRRLLADGTPRQRQYALDRLYQIAGYWLTDTWEGLRQAQDWSQWLVIWERRKSSDGATR